MSTLDDLPDLDDDLFQIYIERKKKAKSLTG